MGLSRKVDHFKAIRASPARSRVVAVEKSPTAAASSSLLRHVGESSFSDDELAELALSADPNAPLLAGAVAWQAGNAATTHLLPDWYMPRPAARHMGRFSRLVTYSLILAFVVINGVGLCITSGFITIA